VPIRYGTQDKPGPNTQQQQQRQHQTTQKKQKNKQQTRKKKQKTTQPQTKRQGQTSQQIREKLQDLITFVVSMNIIDVRKIHQIQRNHAMERRTSTQGFNPNDR